jgi:hypothetical protein
MKNFRSLVLLAVLFLAVHSSRAQTKTPDSLVQKIFATLQAKDQNAFVALYPNAQQFSGFIRDIMQKAFNSDQMKQMMAADEKSKNMNIDSLINAQVTAATGPEAFGKMQTQFGKSFQRIIEKGEQKGVKWNEAKLTNYTVDTSALSDKDAEAFNITGIKEAKGVIDFSVGDSAYQLAYEKIMYIENQGGWFGGEFTQLARKGESLAPDQPSAETSDNAATATDDTDAASESVRTKQKTKTTSSKVKAKTKAPARKPKG